MLTAGLTAFALRHLVDQAKDAALPLLKRHLADPGGKLPRAIRRAADRAWHAVGLSLGGGGLLDRVAGTLGGAEFGRVRADLTARLDLPEAERQAAAREWDRLRRDDRLTALPEDIGELANRAASLDRSVDPASLAASAARAVAEVAAALHADAPHLARALTFAPAGEPPLLASAFVCFLRAEVQQDAELSRGLTFDALRSVADTLEVRTSGILDQIGVLFDVLETQDGKLDAILEKLGRLERERHVPSSPTDPLRVTVTTEAELALVRSLRDQARNLPPELLHAADWSRLGDTLAAAGLYREAAETHAAAADAARQARDRAAEAEAEYKRFRECAEAGAPDDALAALLRAVDLDAGRFAPFDAHRYVPVRILGSGGFGTVFLAEDRYAKNRRVALKCLHSDNLMSLLERDPADAFDEAETLSNLNHPNLVRCLNRGYGDPRQQLRPFLVLEYFEGQTLEAIRQTGAGTLPLSDVLTIGRQIAEAVHAAHAANVLHRDLKPANVMAARTTDAAGGWVVKVIDFGLAARLAGANASMAAPSDRRSTLDRTLVGTLDYAPPEQRGKLAVPVGRYSDVYAWGKTCLELLFGTTDPKGVHWRRLPAEVRERVQELFERATIEDVGERFGDFVGVLAELGDRPAAPVVAPPASAATLVAPPPPPPAPVPPAEETPLQRLKRVKATLADRVEQSRAALSRHDYAAAAATLSDLEPELAEFWANNPLPVEKALLQEACEKRDRLRRLGTDIHQIYSRSLFHDPRLPGWVAQYLALKPDDAEMRELAAELPPPNEPPADPKPGDRYTLRIVPPEPERPPGETFVLAIPAPDRGPAPGTLTTLSWTPVPARANPNAT